MASEWDWTGLGPHELELRWRRLARWTDWLQEHYGHWVKLPACWPLHEALRAELEFLRSWHHQILDDGDGSEGLSWHNSLRTAAASWMVLADCRHEETPWRAAKQRDNAVGQHHLAAAIQRRPSIRP